MAGALLLCAPAFYNGYPLLFSDLLDYGVDGMRILHALWPSGGHPPFYGVAIELLDLERSLWPVVIIQGLITTHLLYIVLRTMGASLRPLAFLALIAGLTLLTSLPWYVSVAMPDLFGGILILAFFLLIFRAHRLGLVEKLYLSALSTACLLFHVSFFPVAIGILVSAAVVAVMRRRQPTRPRLVFPCLVLVAAVGISGLVSLRLWGNVKGPPYAPPYLLAHVLVDGPGRQFLQRQCGVEHFVLCDYQDSIPDDVEEFMFRSFSPFFSSGKTRQIRIEAPAIVAGTFKMFPVQTISAALKGGLSQIAAFYTEVAPLEEIPNGRGGSLASEFAIRLPFVARGYENTMQAQGRLSPAGLRVMNDSHAVVVILSLLLSFPQLVWAARRREWVVVELLLTVLASIAINGLITGAAVGVFGRFGARVIWLLPFAVVVAAISSIRATRRDTVVHSVGDDFRGMATTVFRRQSDRSTGGSRI